MGESSTVADTLLEWFDEQGRELPWRRDRDPYRVWVAEVMLQQTRVETVVDYYERFLDRFPGVEDLAAASQDEVLKLWEGLGYYARARWLHSAARSLVEEYDGIMPRDHAERQTLSGIGEYTSAAIGAFAFGQSHPVLDANVKRVLARVFAVETPVQRADTVRRLESHLEQWLDSVEHPGRLSEAVMELGALVCTARSPRCGDCPIRSRCQARERGLETRLPITPQSPDRPHYEVTAGVVWRDGDVLIARRPEDRMLGGLWEFPGGKQEDGESLRDTLRRELWEELGVEVGVEDRILSNDHEYSHLTITLHAFWCSLRRGSPVGREGQQCRWVCPASLEEYAFPKSNHPILRAVQERSGASANPDSSG